MQAAELAHAIGRPAKGEADARVLNLVVPIFAVSNVSGAQLPALHAFLGRLMPTAAEGISLSHDGDESSDDGSGRTDHMCTIALEVPSMALYVNGSGHHPNLAYWVQAWHVMASEL